MSEPDPRRLIESMPYARMVGIEADMAAGMLITRIAFRDDLVGNARLPALHGGLIGAFLEATALLGLKAALGEDAKPRTIGVTLEYLRPGRARETYARAEIKRLGKRIANVHAEAWQDENHTPIALLQGRFLVGEAPGDDS